MMKVRPAGERGRTRTDWLESRHTFSFNRYYNPEYSGFRALLVLNEDFVQPAQGFGAHSHDNMEILSWVLEGALDHKDSTGASGTLRKDELQRMTAGTGVRHSEFNPSPAEKTHFLQIWLLPQREGLKPGYEQKAFPESERRGRLRLIAAPDGSEGAVTVHQDVRLYDAILAGGDAVSHSLQTGRHAWLQVVRGSVSANGAELGAGDGAAFSDERSVEVRAAGAAEILLFDLA